MAKSFDLHTRHPLHPKHKRSGETKSVSSGRISGGMAEPQRHHGNIIQSNTEFTWETTLRQSVIQSEILGSPIVDVFEKTAPILLCVGDEKDWLEQQTNNPSFVAIQSAKQASIYRQYIDSFCSDIDAYGMKSQERKAIEVKEKAYAFLDSLTVGADNATSNIVCALAKIQGSNADVHGEYQMTYALALYLQGKDKNLIVPSLTGALKKGCVEAGMILLYVEASVDRRDSVYARLQNLAEFKLRAGLGETVCSAYNIKPSAITPNGFLGITGGNNNE